MRHYKAYLVKTSQISKIPTKINVATLFLVQLLFLNGVKYLKGHQNFRIQYDSCININQQVKLARVKI